MPLFPSGWQCVSFFKAVTGCLKGNMSLENHKLSLQAFSPAHPIRNMTILFLLPETLSIFIINMSVYNLFGFSHYLCTFLHRITVRNESVTGKTERNAPATSGDRSRVFLGLGLGYEKEFLT